MATNRDSVIGFAIGLALLASTAQPAERRHAARHVAPPAISVVVVAGEEGTVGSDDGAVGSARFSSPRGVAYDSTTGSIIVADTANHTIRRIRQGQVTTIAGSARNAGTTDGAGADSRFRLPHGIAVDSSGRIWICDTANHSIRRIETDGSVTTVAGRGGVPGDVDGTARNARFDHPEGIAIDPRNGDVFIADTGNHALRRISGGNVTTVTMTSPLRYPVGMTFDAAGNLWIAERGNDAVRKVAASGEQSVTSAGGRAPASVAVLGDSVYLTDFCHHRLGKLTGETVAEGLLYPYGLSVGDRELLIADSRHHVIRALRGVAP